MNAPLFVQIGKPAAISFWQNLKLYGKIDWQFLDPTILSSIIIDKSALVLNSWRGYRLVPNQRYRGSEKAQLSLPSFLQPKTIAKMAGRKVSV